MKKNVTSLLAKTIIAALPFLVLDWLYITADFYHGNKNISRFRPVPDGIELANTGSSHGGDITYDVFPDYMTFNAAMPAQTLPLDLAIMREYIGHFAPGGVLLVLVSYFNVDAEIEPAQLARFEDRYYHILSYRNIPGVTPWKYIKFRFFPILGAHRPFRTIRKYLVNKDFWENLTPKKDEIFVMDNDAVLDDIPELRTGADVTLADVDYGRLITPETVARGWGSMFPRKGAEGYRENRRLLGELRALCEAHGVMPVIVSVPMPAVTNRAFDQLDFFPTYERFKRDVLADWNSAGGPYHWLDYSHDAEFTDDYTLFADSGHMNRAGALAFTTRLRHDLAELGMLPPHGE